MLLQYKLGQIVGGRNCHSGRTSILVYVHSFDGRVVWSGVNSTSALEQSRVSGLARSGARLVTPAVMEFTFTYTHTHTLHQEFHPFMLFHTQVGIYTHTHTLSCRL